MCFLIIYCNCVVCVLLLFCFVLCVKVLGVFCCLFVC